MTRLRALIKNISDFKRRSSSIMMRSFVEIMSDRVFAIAVAQFVLAMMIRGELQAAPADEEFSKATRLAAAGAFADSVTHWKKAEALFEEAKNFPGQVETEIHLAAAYHALGQIRLATETLMRAQDLALLKDQKHLAQIKAGLGSDLHPDVSAGQRPQPSRADVWA